MQVASSCNNLYPYIGYSNRNFFVQVKLALKISYITEADYFIIQSIDAS
jgi:hypothetical protein